MRPPGESRSLLLGALELAGPCSLRDLCHYTGLEYGSVRTTLQNTVRASAVVKVAERREPHSRRPVALYNKARLDQSDQAAHALDGAIRSFWERPAADPVDPQLTTID